MNIRDTSFPSGAPVYDAGGEKLGTVSDRQDKDGFLVVHKGHLFSRDALIPHAAIDWSDMNGVHLRVRKDELKGLNQTPLPESTATMAHITGNPGVFASDPLPVPVVTGVPEPEMGLATPLPSAASVNSSPASAPAVDGIREQVGPLVDTLRERVGPVVGPLADQVKDQASAVAQQQMTSAAEGLESAAGAVNVVGDRMRENHLGELSQYTDLAAEQIEKLATWLRTTTPDEIAHDIEDFAKKQPAVFVAGALALGLIGVRFLRSTSQDHNQNSDETKND